VLSRGGAEAGGAGVRSLGIASGAELVASGTISNACATMPLTDRSVASRTAQAQPLSGRIKPESMRSFLNTISALE
jgi:hypothetical protein